MITRRALGAGALATALGAVGCAPAVQAPSAAPGTPVSPPSPVADRPPSTPPASPSATPSPTPTGPDPDEVARRFAKKKPTDWGMHLPGIVSELEEPSTADGRARIALTFDACGGKHGSGFDERLISGLVDRGVPATLFVNLRWIEANPDVVKDLLTEPRFELGNHGTRHIPLSVTGREAYGIAGSASASEAVAEVWECHQRLAELLGAPPRFFRSGTAHYDDVGVAIATALGGTPLGFSLNGDAGATFPAATVRSEVRSARPGGIVIAHFNRPDSGTAKGMLAAVDDLMAEGVEFVHPIHHN